MYLIDVRVIGILLLVLYILFDLFKNKTNNLFKRSLFYSFLFYLINVLQVTTGGIYLPPREEYRIVTVQMLPFQFLLDWIHLYQSEGGGWFFWNSVRLSLYNVLLLLPLGIYLPVLLNKRKAQQVTLYTFLVSLVIEIYQMIFSHLGLIFLRTANVDDLILNTIGGALGFYMYKILLSRWIHKIIK